MTMPDRSRRNGALWHALARLDDDPSVRPGAHAFIVDKAPWFTEREWPLASPALRMALKASRGLRPVQASAAYQTCGVAAQTRGRFYRKGCV
jgi:hypothetical protein